MYYITKEKNGKQHYFVDYNLSLLANVVVDWTRNFDDRMKIDSLFEAEALQKIVHGDKITVWAEDWDKAPKDFNVVGDHTKWEVKHTNCDCRVCYMSREIEE